MDRNQATGLLLISILLIGYLYFFGDSTPPAEENTIPTEQQSQQTEESTNPTSSETEAPAEELVLVDSGDAYFELLTGEEEEFILENKNLRVAFSSKGGYPREVQLKRYKTWEKKPLTLFDQGSSRMAMLARDRQGEEVNLYDFYYDGRLETKVTESDTSRILTFSGSWNGGNVIQRYELRNGSFELLYSMDLGPLASNLSSALSFNWEDKLKRFEKTMDQSRNQSSLNFLDRNGDVIDVSNDNDPEEEKVEINGVKWFSMKQRFFNAGFIAPDYMGEASFTSSFDPADSSVIKHQMASVEIPVAMTGGSNEAFRYYLGPNNYQVLKKVDQGYGENVYLGWTIFATVNKYTVVPFFNFLEKYISNYGLLIFILVIVVKIILFPLSYKSYTSMARMKVLRPEIEEIKEMYPEDQQKVQMETMKLYQKFGVNPLSGCVPVALQIPVLFALFNFFPNSIELRQQSFLWADDLSTYDSILDLPFSIPFYGDHVSLFTLLMTVSTIGYTYVQNQGNPMQQQGPMKTMQYFFPIMIMFFLNNFSSGLTYYYFLSNVVTIVQQFIIRKFTDDSDIRAKLEAKQARKKNKKKSGFRQKLENAMEDRMEGSNRAMRRQIGKKK